MHRLAILFLLSAATRPALGLKRIESKHIDLKRVSIQQLERKLEEASPHPGNPLSDADFARILSSVQLTERMSRERYEHWKQEMPGLQSTQNLIALADSSAFLELPPEDLPKLPAPKKEAQQQAMNAASNYVVQVLQKLPNFFAGQSVTTYLQIDGMRNQAGVLVNQPLHYAGLVKTNVRYRDDKEIIDTGKGELTETDRLASGLLFSGEFGPILNTVFRDTQGKFSWNHWEPGANSPLAVFRYSVPHNKSHCTVKVQMPGTILSAEQRPAYHGEIAVDPTSGIIYRLTLIADLNPEDPLGRAETVVEYGPVEIGGVSYICPVRSIRQVSVYDPDAKLAFVVTGGGTDPVGGRAPSNMSYTTKSEIPSQTLLNDTVYEQYHLLRSDTRMISDDDKAGDDKHKQQ